MYVYIYVCLSIGYLIGERVDIFHRSKFDQFVVTFSLVNRSTKNTRCICIVCFSARTAREMNIIKTSVSVSYLTLRVDLLVSCGRGKRKARTIRDRTREMTTAYYRIRCLSNKHFLFTSFLFGVLAVSLPSTFSPFSIDIREELLHPSILILIWSIRTSLSFDRSMACMSELLVDNRHWREEFPAVVNSSSSTDEFSLSSLRIDERMTRMAIVSINMFVPPMMESIGCHFV